MAKIGSKLLLTTGLAAIIYVGATHGYMDMVQDVFFSDPNNIYNYRTLTITEEERENIINNVEDNLGYNVIDSKEDDYLLLNAVLENNNLNDENKYKFLEYGDMFYDNPYLNREKVYRNLRDVKVQYGAIEDEEFSSIKGLYDYDTNTISIFSVADGVMGHEIIHCIYNVDRDGLDRYFSEGMTELLYNEYFEENPFLEINTYTYEISAVKMLADICGSDVILQAFSESSMKPIIDSLASYSSKKEATENIRLLDELMLEYETTGSVTHYVEYEDMLDYFTDISEKKYNFDNNCFDYNSFDYNKNMFKNIFSTDNIESYLDYIEEVGIGEKYYFNKKLEADYTYFKVVPCDLTFEVLSYVKKN